MVAISQMKKQQLIVKHAKKFVGNSFGSPVLHGVHYAANGDAIMTNRHYALIIKNAHSNKKSITFELDNFEQIDGQYPDVKKVFPKRFSTEFEISKDGEPSISDAVKRVKMAFDIAKSIDRGVQKGTLALMGDIMVCFKKGDDEIYYAASLGENTSKQNLKSHLNLEYLYNSLVLFRDAGSNVITFKFSGGIHPFVISDDENGIEILILPYRTSEDRA